MGWQVERKLTCSARDKELNRCISYLVKDISIKRTNFELIFRQQQNALKQNDERKTQCMKSDPGIRTKIKPGNPTSIADHE